MRSTLRGMRQPSDFLVPGYREPIGSWPEAELRAYREHIYEHMYDWEPVALQEMLFKVRSELDRRAAGGERGASTVVDFSRAVETLHRLASEATPAREPGGGAAPFGGEPWPANQNMRQSPSVIAMDRQRGLEIELEP